MRVFFSTLSPQTSTLNQFFCFIYDENDIIIEKTLKKVNISNNLKQENININGRFEK